MSLAGDSYTQRDVEPLDLEQLLVDRTAQRQTSGTMRLVSDAGRFFEGIFDNSPVAGLGEPRVPSPIVATGGIPDRSTIPNPHVTVGR